MDKILLEFIEFRKDRLAKWPKMTDENIIKEFLQSKRLVLIDDSDSSGGCTLYQHGIKSVFESIGVLRFWEKRIFVDQVNGQPKEEKTAPDHK